MSENAIQQAPLPPAARAVARLVATGKDPLPLLQHHGIDDTEYLRWLSHPDWHDLVESFTPSPDEIRTRFRQLATSAVDRIAKLMDESRDPRVQLNAARDLLDRAGFTPVRTIGVVTFNLSDEHQRLVRETLSEELTEHVEDAEVVPEPSSTPPVEDSGR